MTTIASFNPKQEQTGAERLSTYIIAICLTRYPNTVIQVDILSRNRITVEPLMTHTSENA